jgi:hypothetical protein
MIGGYLPGSYNPIYPLYSPPGKTSSLFTKPQVIGGTKEKAVAF